MFIILCIIECYNWLLHGIYSLPYKISNLITTCLEKDAEVQSVLQTTELTT